MSVDLAWRIERHDSITSTMDRAAELALGGEPAGTVVVAEEQTAGRGRHGRSWQAPHGTCLLFTVLLRPQLPVAQNPHLSVQIAERVRDAIHGHVGIQPDIKKPNDLLVRGRKLAGILCQSSIRGEHLDYLLIGIGINANIPAELLPLPTATSLLIETGQQVDRDALLHAVLERLPEVAGLTEGVARVREIV